MNQASILFLDLNLSTDLGRTLRSMFEKSCGDKAVRAEYLESSLSRLSPQEVAGLAARFAPLVICLALPSAPLREMTALLETIKASLPRSAIVVVTEESEPDYLFELLEAGASDFMSAPVRTVEILPRILRQLEHARRGETAARSLKEQLGMKQIIGENGAFLAEIKKIPVLARCDASVLISGETGTGKELCARAIHYLSPRSSKPFLPVNCGAMPAELIENELFGHERGAFTDASAARHGLVREAEGGTLFLDEVDSIPPFAQVKLLRFLQEKEYRALGSTKTRTADVRVIAATNADLELAVRSGRLRRDFYYRLNTVPFVLAPLRERRDDIPLLVRSFLKKCAARYGKPTASISPEAMQTLLAYDWPGNVRELEHIIERAVVLSENAVITECELVLSDAEGGLRREAFKEAKAKIVAQFEKSYIQGLLVAFEGNITRAARAANKNRRAFWQLIRKYRIDVQSFKAGAV
jgi:DNA-binding NtrC family response regulator